MTPAAKPMTVAVDLAKPGADKTVERVMTCAEAGRRGGAAGAGTRKRFSVEERARRRAALARARERRWLRDNAGALLKLGLKGKP